MPVLSGGPTAISGLDGLSDLSDRIYFYAYRPGTWDNILDVTPPSGLRSWNFFRSEAGRNRSLKKLYERDIKTESSRQLNFLIVGDVSLRTLAVIGKTPDAELV